MADSNDPKNSSASAVNDDDEPDDWDKRIFSTGCAEENTRLNDCFYEKKDWRACKAEVSDNDEWTKARLVDRDLMRNGVVQTMLEATRQ